MNTIDIILTCILLTGIVRGFMKGFIYEIAVLGTYFLCYYLGFKLSESVSGLIGSALNISSSTLHYVSLLLVWIGISIGMFFLARLFEGLVNIAALGLFNKIAGAILGGMKYAFLTSLCLFFLNKIEFDFGWLNDDTKAESTFYYPLLRISEMIVD